MMIRCEHSNCIAPAEHIIDFEDEDGDDCELLCCDRHYAEITGRLERASTMYHDLLARGVHPAMAERVVDGMMGE